MSEKQHPSKKKKMTKKQRRAYRRRLRLSLFSGLAAAVLVALAAWSRGRLSFILWLIAAAGLAVLTALLRLRRGLKKPLYWLMASVCALLAVGGVFARGSVIVDGAVVPVYTQAEQLRVTDAWPEDIGRYTRLNALDMRDSSVTDFTPILSMDALRQLDVRGNYAFTYQDYVAVMDAHPDCAVYWSIPVGDGHIDSTENSYDLTAYGPSAEEVNALRQRFPDKTFTYAVTLMGKRIDPSAEAIDLQGAANIDPDEIAAALSLLPNVKEVDLRGAPLPVETVEALQAARDDVRFRFTCDVPGTPMTSEDQTVTLTGGSFADLQRYMAYMPYMPNLEYIDARTVALTGEDIQSLQADERARKIVYGFSVYGKNVTTLDTELNLDGVPISDPAQVETIIRMMPNLQRLSMVGCGLSDDAMGALFDAHPQIKFVWEVSFGKYRLRTDATAFTTNLYAVNDYHYTSATFAPLRYCTDLMMLDLGHCDITSIEGLAGLTKLRVLILADNEITDISPLAGLNDLEYVELFMNRGIRDFTPLANKEKLVDLNIYYCQIQDVAPLTTCTNLQRLWLGECGLSDGQIGKLRKALPNCKINAHGSSSTGHGWREHRHYEVLKQMYKTGQYIPFD